MERQAFIHGVERLRSDLLRQARHYLGSTDDAEDVVQETLVKLWMAKERIADASKLRNMAAVVCRNVSLNLLRRAECSIPIEEAEPILLQGNPQVELEERESRQKLRQSIRSLSDKQRAIIRMRNVEGMSYADMARILGTTESSVRGMISKARMELLKQMKGTIE